MDWPKHFDQSNCFPGIGREYVTSITNRDYSMIMATTLIFAVQIALANLSAGLLYA